MKPTRIILSALAAATLATGASAAPPKEASIPFVSSGSIRDWRAVDRDTLYVQATGGKWYRAELMGPCHDLNFAQTIGFDASGTDRFDRFSSVIVRGQRCAVQSLVASDAPPKKAKSVRKG